MTDDLITRAEAVEGACGEEYEFCEYPEIVGELIEEVERLRSASRKRNDIVGEMLQEIIDKDEEIRDLKEWCDRAEESMSGLAIKIGAQREIIDEQDIKISELESKLAPKKYYPPLYDVDEEFPKTPLGD